MPAHIIRMLLVISLGIGLPVAAETGADADAQQDPAKWADRMERALLPQASLRAELLMRSSDPNHPVQGFGGRLVRVQDAERIRSILIVEQPTEARRILRIESLPKGAARRVQYTGAGNPIELEIPRSERILRTSLTYEDLAFVPLAHRGDTLELEESVVRLTSQPYDGYGRVVTRIDRKLGLPIDVEFFDRSGKLQRKVTYGQVEKAGPYSFPLRIEATDYETGFKTTVQLLDVELNAEVHEHEFEDHYNRQLIHLVE